MSLFRQSLIYLILTAITVYFSSQIHLFIIYVDTAFVSMNIQLHYYFTNGWLAKTLTLILLPFVIASVPAGLYWLFKQKRLPYFLELTWFVWLVFVLSNALLR